LIGSSTLSDDSYSRAIRVSTALSLRLARLEYPHGSDPSQVWYQIGTAEDETGWIVARIEDKFYVDEVTADSDPCDGKVPEGSDLTFIYDRQAAANYAIEHSWQNNSLPNPIAGGRVTRRLGSNNQSGFFIPFANFTYSMLTGEPGETGSAMFISEVIWAGGLPMTKGEQDSCNVSATYQAGWCWISASSDPSNPWDKHEQIVAYYTDSLAPYTVSGFNIDNTVLAPEDKGTLLFFIDTLQPDYLSGNRLGKDNFYDPDEPETTDFNISIPTLRKGEVDDLASLESLIITNLANLKTGDYILIDPVNTGGGAHGLFVVGWGPIEDCVNSLQTRRTVEDFSLTRTMANTVPYVADFAQLLQSPTPRPFYCSMHYDQILPITGRFNRHNWHVYTLPETITLAATNLYIDENWSWTASMGQ